mmetsp:Transcript_20363/g.62965  ORF Transcript_20363/g.62965 Transcript_20363/m.62965 type:complete len:393 (+) Transcript_20363:74-1252(+)
MESAVKVLTTTLDDMVLLDKLETGNFAVRCEPFAVVEMLESAVSVYVRAGKNMGVSIDVQIENALKDIVLYGDPRVISRCVSSFLSNAITASAKGAQSVTVSAVAFRLDNPEANVHSPPSGPLVEGHTVSSVELVIEVNDHCRSTSTTRKKRLFQPYTHLRSGELHEGRCSGLGLVISREAIEQHGGRASVRSELGESSVYSVRLPLAVLGEVNESDVAHMQVPLPALSEADPTTVPTGGTPGRAASEAPESAGKCPTLRALVVDDVQSNRRLLGFQLTRLGFDVREARDGHEATQICGHACETNDALGESFDIIFMDCVMPILDGIEATAVLRRAGHKCPIIGVTANALHEDIENFLRAGASAVLTKPVSKDRLATEVEAVGLALSTNSRI